MTEAEALQWLFAAGWSRFDAELLLERAGAWHPRERRDVDPETLRLVSNDAMRDRAGS